MGVLYRCEECEDYDLCSKCYEKGIHPEHKKREITEANIYHWGYGCDGCGFSPIIGDRYHCTSCPDYDLCGRCRDDKKHPEHRRKLKLITEIGFQQLLNGLMIDDDREIVFPHDFTVGGKTRVHEAFTTAHLLLKLQALVRQDIHLEIKDLLKGIVIDGDSRYSMSAVDLDGLLKAKFMIPIRVSAKKSNEEDQEPLEK